MVHQLVGNHLDAETVTALGRVSLFSFLSQRELETISIQFERRHYVRGKVVFHQDEEPANLYVVKCGRIKVHLLARDGSRHTVGFHSTGGFFGQRSLIDHKRRAVEAIAVEPTELLVLPKRDFLAYLAEYPETSIVLLDHYLHQSRVHLQHLYDVIFVEGPSRLAKTLLHYAVPRNDDKGLEVVLTQADLAELMGARLESVNRWLKGFANEGLICQGRSRIAILDPNRLRTEAEQIARADGTAS